MTDEIDLLREALQKHDQASRLKRINEELYSHLTGSIYYLLKYAEKQNITLPQKEVLFDMVEKADFIIDQFAKTVYKKDVAVKTLDKVVAEPPINRQGTGITIPKREQNRI